ncbi:MAG: hypothetical protein MUD13_10825, partial [Candidatus Nanopelagicales bacterium]|nr:hypothetical protein [Candidatus Nanopelagicales bacterium]
MSCTARPSAEVKPTDMTSSLPRYRAIRRSGESVNTSRVPSMRPMPTWRPSADHARALAGESPGMTSAGAPVPASRTCTAPSAKSPVSRRRPSGDSAL